MFCVGGQDECGWLWGDDGEVLGLSIMHASTPRAGESAGCGRFDFSSLFASAMEADEYCIKTYTPPYSMHSVVASNVKQNTYSSAPSFSLHHILP